MNYTKRSLIRTLFSFLGIGLIARERSISADPEIYSEAKDSEGMVESVAISNGGKGISIHGAVYVFGVAPLKPFLGIGPDARVRVKMRKAQYAVAYVKTGGTICTGYIQDSGEHWIFVPREANHTSLG